MAAPVMSAPAGPHSSATMVVGAAVREMLAITKARFGADSDFTVIAKLLEEWAGVEIRR
jgi:hypothetical protein